MKALVAILAVASSALAQDTRKVVEPVIPPSCTVLKAKIGRGGMSLAPADESKSDTARIQAALDACPAGQAVVLERSKSRTDAFLSGPLYLRRGVTLVVVRGAYLFASRNPRDYDLQPGVCGTINKTGHGCKALINGDGVAGAGIMGDGVIDGRGGETMLGQNISWWNLADLARTGDRPNNRARLIALHDCDNFTLYRITLMNSPEFHVATNGGNGFTAWGVKIWSPERARNTDGIDPGSSSNITIAHCYIHTGDDNVAIKAGGHVSHVTVAHNHFYSGHGMSIGSETYGGADAIRVTDLSIDGADNGLRIKSNITRGGLVRDVVYDDVCIRDTENPILMDSNYSAGYSQHKDRPPVFRDILLRNVRVEGGGKVTLEGLDEAHRLGIAFDNVWFDDPAAIRAMAQYADIKIGPGAFNLKFTGSWVTVTGSGGPSVKNACAGKFVPFPVH